jgi:hypothetical protein
MSVRGYDREAIPGVPYGGVESFQTGTEMPTARQKRTVASMPS